MGGCCSKKASREWRANKYALGDGDFTAMKDEEQKHSRPASPATADRAAPEPPAQPIKLDPKDFKYVGGRSEVKIKAPGTINGQSFTIDDCHDCDIYVLDHTGQVTVDDCKRCRIFLGPTDGSVFLRNCSDCAVAVMCRQLRTRDCVDCRVALLCRTRPIVESSSGMLFTCFDMPYPQLAAHMVSAKLSPFHNFWWHVFDFTKKEGNWRLQPPAGPCSAPGAGHVLDPVPAEVAELMALGSTGAAAPALALARKASDLGWLLHTNEARLSSAATATLAAEAGWPKSASRALTTPDAKGPGCVGLELALGEGPEAEALEAEAVRLGGLVSRSEAPGSSFRGMGVDG
ncbi:Protein XRP2 [Tetrabaena socialis]|uniref:Protein XRP2 n=1 Tax=Tetrabaena socialis TaxID=47790 RepID=A0A2J8AC84_9CHLO|nr:Protein XRP2 [Tetrabaena socialis]|eukprot:PNH10117.1 Protein XRP2 [Tetrabaena socialis]